MAKLFITDDVRNPELSKAVSALYPAIDHQSIQTYLMLRKLSTELESSLEVFFSTYGLSSGRFLLMLLLKSSPEGLMPTELSLKVGVTQATISGLISSLEKSALIKREVHKKDGRAFVIQLTEKGQALVDTITPIFFGRVNDFMAAVTPQEKDSTMIVLGTLLEQVKLFGNPSPAEAPQS